MSILVYGSLVPDIVFPVPVLPAAGEDVPAGTVSIVPAGGGGNVAMALAGWGYETYASGNSVGDDPLGRWTADQFTAAGIRLVDGYTAEDGVTPPNAIIVTPDGERTIIGSTYEQVQWLPVDWHGVEAVAVDAYSGTAGAEVIREASARLLPTVATDRGPVPGLTVLMWSGSEHPDPDEARAAASDGTMVVVTAGPAPITVYTGSDEQQIAIEPVEVASTRGAGDVLAAGVVAALHDGRSPLAAVEQAAKLATRHVSGKATP